MSARRFPEASSDGVPIASTVLSWSARPARSLASAVRALLVGSCENLLETDEVQRIGMAGYELTDNLIKYSLGGEGHFDAAILRRESGVYVRLCSVNPATPENRRDVRHLVARLQSAPSALDVYDELIASSPSRAGSGLGLARIQAEGEMTLDCMADDARVTLVAGRRVAVRERP